MGVGGRIQTLLILDDRFVRVKAYFIAAIDWCTVTPEYYTTTHI